MFLTADVLEQAGACREQLELFRERFPEGCIPTAALCRQYPDFNYDWAAKKLLSPEKWAAYGATVALHWAAYRSAVAPHLAAYQAARAPHWAAYEAARAETFGRLWEEPCK